MLFKKLGWITLGAYLFSFSVNASNSVSCPSGFNYQNACDKVCTLSSMSSWTCDSATTTCNSSTQCAYGYDCTSLTYSFSVSCKCANGNVTTAPDLSYTVSLNPCP